MSAPQPIPSMTFANGSQIIFRPHRWGKTHAMQQAMQQMGQAAQSASRALSGLRAVIISHDELRHHDIYRPIGFKDRDRSHFEDGGRHRKPPESTLAVAKEPGMVQMRNRRGELVWKKLGNGVIAGTDAARMREQPTWGSFG